MENNGDGIDGMRSVVLRRNEASGMGLGFSIMGGAGYDFPPVIYGIEKDSPAARSGVLEAGDIILAINEREVVKLSTKEVLKCLRLSGDIVHIKYKRGDTKGTTSDVESTSGLLSRRFVFDNPDVFNYPVRRDSAAVHNPHPHVVSRVRKFLSTPASHYLQTGSEVASPNHVHGSSNVVHKGSPAWQNLSQQTTILPPPVSPRSKITSAAVDRAQTESQNPNHISSFSEDLFINHSHSQQVQQSTVNKSFQQNNPFANNVEKNGRKNFETFVMTGEAILNLTRTDANDSYRSPTKTSSKLTPMSPMPHHVVLDQAPPNSFPIDSPSKGKNSLSVEEDSPPLPPPPPSNNSSKSEKILADEKSDILPPPPPPECQVVQSDSVVAQQRVGASENGVVVCNNSNINNGSFNCVDIIKNVTNNNNEDTSISSSVMSDSAEEILNDDDDDENDADDQELLIGNGDKDKNRIILKVEQAKQPNSTDPLHNRDFVQQQQPVAEKERYPEYLLLGKGSPNASEEDELEPNSVSESLTGSNKKVPKGGGGSKDYDSKFSEPKDSDTESEADLEQGDESSEMGGSGRAPNNAGSGGDSDSSDVESMRVAPVVKAVDLPSAERLAKRLFSLDGFRVTDVWRQLCKCNEFSRAVATEYLKFFDFRDQPLDVSLRKFLSICPLRGETSERERVLEHFSIRYVECNPGVLGSGDSVHTLTCALMLLNTDMYSEAKARRPMTCADFIKNLNGLNDGKDFPKEILKQLYHSIKSKPLVSPADAEEEEDSNREVLPIETPISASSTEFKRGYLMRKSTFETGGKKTPLGKRSWKMFFCRLRELLLVLSHDEVAKTSGAAQNTQPIKVHHCYATVASEYQKRPHVFKVILADRSQFLFQSSDSREMASWIDILNWNAAKFSAPALEPPCSSARRFERPLLPTSITRLNTRDQLASHQTTLARFDEELNEWTQLLSSKSASSNQKKEIKERLAFYQFEIRRYRTYIDEIEKRINDESDHNGTEELVELQVLPNPPSVLVEESDENL